eukprot:540991_1
MAQEAPKKNKDDKIPVIEDILRNEFEPTHLEVINEMHTCDNMRIKVIIVSDKFKDLSTIDRHRNVQTALGVKFTACAITIPDQFNRLITLLCIDFNQ